MPSSDLIKLEDRNNALSYSKTHTKTNKMISKQKLLIKKEKKMNHGR